jgi:hypothetical protein
MQNDWLRAGQPRGRISRPGKDEIFFVHVVQTGSGAHQVSDPMGNEDSFSGGKLGGREADHSTPTNAEVKNTWIYTSTSPLTFMG